MSNQTSSAPCAQPSRLTWDSTAVETTAADGTPLFYTWRDLDAPAPRIANLLALKLPKAAAWPCRSKIGRSHGPVPGHAARATSFAAQHRLPKRRDRILHRQRRARRGGVQPRQLWLVSKIAFTLGTQHVFTWVTTAPAACLDRAAHHGDEHQAVRQRRRPGRHPLHQRHHRPQQGRHATHGNMLSNAVMLKGLLGLDGWGA